MNHISLFLSILMSSLLLGGCASVNEKEANQRPGWIESAQLTYPIEGYLTALGQGNLQTEAEQHARANLVEIVSLPMRIEAKKQTNSAKQRSVLGDPLQATNVLQDSIEIKERWQNKDGAFYALAVIDRSKAAKDLIKTIEALDKKIEHLIDYSSNIAPNTVLAFNTLWSARHLQLIRDTENAQLQYISDNNLPSIITDEQIEQRIKQKLAMLTMSVDSNSYNGLSSLQAALSQLGVKVVDNASLHISSRMDITEPSYINAWFWIRGSYELIIKENGQVISRKRWPIKVATKDAELLVPRLQDKLRENINGYVQEMLREPPTF
jgi:hypothetical protein